MTERDGLSRCLHCGAELRFCRFGDIAYEPDYDPTDDAWAWRHPSGYAACGRFAEPRPEIVVLCGSTRFMDAFREANLRLTLDGKIVLSVGCDTKSDDGLGITAEQKAALDELHKRKIDVADRVLVLNVGGYVGTSTAGEIEYAKDHHKPVEYLEPRDEDNPA